MPSPPRPAVQVFPGPELLDRRLAAPRHLPHALPLLRRLRFARRFPGGCSEWTRVLYSGARPLLLPESASSSGETEDAGDGDGDDDFAAAYLDLSRGPETEIWIYSSVERLPSPTESQQRSAARYAGALLREVRAQLSAYVAGGGGVHARPEAPAPGAVLAGTLSAATRGALRRHAGVAVPWAAAEPAYDKWVFRVDALPREDGSGSSLPDGMRWDAVRPQDIALVLARNHVPRKERTVKLLKSTAIYRDDGTPVAWAFLGPDSSLSSLHVEEPYRGRGLAKALAVKLLRDHVQDYDELPYAWADVATDNTSSQGVCRSLGGKVMWTVYWSHIDLDQSFPDP
ncbi:hypothetical protein F4780DRAFT_770827 [Xylariomycetidae sp. FL0641]|nr:hypothetical protein F4780DRAFT_788649 [Xylariomycetidae sp. FL0641]KAI0020176.1 hypothetical protein F4780DRAFT_770827 [Xylariomycetidae sp. FL0641]